MLLGSLFLACALVSDAELAARMDVDGDGVPRPSDCDDGDAQIGVATEWYADADADGFGAGAASSTCVAPEGFVSTADDCDDTDAAAFPGSIEVCDVADNDCDGATDEDDAADALTWYRDADGDLYGTDADTFVSCGAPAGYVGGAGDCDDAAATVNPGEREACDGRDEDCSGTADDPHWYLDADVDAFGLADNWEVACTAPDGRVELGTDCDDGNAAINPAAREVCDDLDADEDCDGLSDDLDANVTGTLPAYRDDDADGHGASTRAVAAACELADGYAWAGDDCDDGEATVHPGVAEVCYDGLDQNCDGVSDWDCDLDGFEEGEDCDDGDDAVSPGVLEVCGNDADEDCDGVVGGVCALSGEVSLARAEGRIVGTETEAWFALEVASGDFDGNGADDLAIGASEAGDTTGNITIVDGPWTGTGSGDHRLDGGYGDYLGSSLISADLDDDGIDDLVAGLPMLIRQEGGLRVFLGAGRSTWSTVSPDYAYDADEEFGGGLGFALADAGDLSGDGFDDVLVGARSNGGAGEGAVGLLLGGAAGSIGLGDIWLTGESSSEQAGFTVAGGQDLDGDGVVDFVVGTGNSGLTYVVFGPITESAGLGDADVVMSEGYNAVIAIPGDLTGDGRPDVAMGTSSAAAAFVFEIVGAASMTVSDATATFTGDSGSYAGFSIAGAGDVNGDGRPDLLVGAPGFDPSLAGSAYLLLAPLTANRDLADADGVLQGEGFGDLAGYSVAGAGDVDADGYADIVIGAPHNDAGATDGGAAYLLFGGEP